MINDLNKKKCYNLLIEHNKFFNNLLKYIDENETKKIPESFYLKQAQLYTEVLLSNAVEYKDNTEKNKVEVLLNFLSIETLSSNKFIEYHQDKHYFILDQHIEHILRDITDDYTIKLNLKTVGIFKDHTESLKRLIGELANYNAFNANEIEIFHKEIEEILRKIRKDLENNMNSIKYKANSLSHNIDSNQNKSDKESKIKELLKFNDQYISPFLNFISDSSKGGLNSVLYKLSKKIYKIDPNMGFLINNISIHFSTYKKTINEIIQKINNYKSQSEQDLIIFNGIERCFNEVYQLTNELSDGRKSGYKLTSTNFHEQYDIFNNMLSNDNNFIKLNDYDYLIDNLEIFEKDLFIEFNIKEENNNVSYHQDNEKIIIDAKEIEKEYNNKLKDEEKEKEKIDKIIHILNKKIDYLLNNNTEDIMLKVHETLKDNIENYELYDSIFATSFLCESYDNIYYNAKKFNYIEFGNLKFKHLPLYHQNIEVLEIE